MLVFPSRMLLLDAFYQQLSYKDICCEQFRFLKYKIIIFEKRIYIIVCDVRVGNTIAQIFVLNFC
jgi:hypothetical protein